MPHRYPHPGAAPFSTLPAAALRATLQEGYGAEDLRRDVFAGIVVGVVALPLSMALAIAVGVAPGHGLITAVVGGILVAALGGSRTQVTGPTAAFVVILAPIVSRFGLGGLLVAGMMAGAILVGLSIARMGKLLQFIPHPVTTGFTAGIATVIATLQVKDLLGLEVAHMPEHYLERVAALARALPSTSFAEMSVGLGTLALLIAAPRLTKRVPAPLIALTVASVSVYVARASLPGLSVDTIGSRFDLVSQPLALGLPWSFQEGIHFDFGLTAIRKLVPAAFAIAMLGAIESLLSAVVADGMAGTKHNPDAELFGQGIGNLVVPFFGGIACTGAIARTATNIRSGARSPVASMVHALTVYAAVAVLAPVLRHIPMASLAALLLLVAWNMSERKHVKHILQVAPRGDVAVLVVCFTLTVVFDMVIGVAVGIVFAALVFMRRMAEVTQTQLVAGSDDPTFGTMPRGVLAYRIAGPLFFGAAEKAMSTLQRIESRVHVVILDLSQVSAIDVTGLVALESAIAHVERNGARTLLVGLGEQPRKVIERGFGHGKGSVELFDAFPPALERARSLVPGTAATPEPSPVAAPVPR